MRYCCSLLIISMILYDSLFVSNAFIKSSKKFSSISSRLKLLKTELDSKIVENNSDYDLNNVSVIASNTEQVVRDDQKQPYIQQDFQQTNQNSITVKTSQTQYELSPQQSVYVVLTSIFVTCLIIADVIGVKLFQIDLPFPILGHTTVEHTCGMIIFPVTFLLGDVINEYYGSKAAKNTVYIGLAMSILVFIVINIAQAMPYLDKPFNISKDSFDSIFGSAKIMYIASVSAYLAGSMADIWLFGVIKKATKGKYLWLRATGSTFVSQILDSFVVSYVAFSLGKSLTGQTPATLPEVLSIASTGYGLKFLIALLLTPALYALKEVMAQQFDLQPLPYIEEESGV
mmetsp:Transcript_14614/g.14079  ORF Transcript_14614/g.14079 Transcript_14614/m.14079 type:complete len:343 (-) Transcript_14614:9-1037(-)|eukprot:CAMPEP_0119047446 /NCGR_PEP_ID=MMETSP1177-20130426/53099_1 /TAXON_ID=2985 /ORGANISM="Ochromonas sp, Strain CCMP1899" /LENGTH=342 /DNA_ID=CAMNT_0007022039 /DNA_START=123 /DNA_END=1151 /DNA_ORIENTATION=-